MLGNNENGQVLAAFWYWPQYISDYRKLYVDHIKGFLEREDPHIPYVSSSPTNGLQTVKDDYTSKDPNQKKWGDVHYYNDGGNLWDWKTYPSARFVSEYGFQSHPSVKTYLRALPKESLTFPTGDALQHRQRHGNNGNTVIENMLGMSLIIK